MDGPIIIIIIMREILQQQPPHPSFEQQQQQQQQPQVVDYESEDVVSSSSDDNDGIRMRLVEDLEMGGTPCIITSTTISSSSAIEYYKDETYPEQEIYFDAHEEEEEELIYRYRTILPKDRARIQVLHEEWFPVVYQEEFYDNLVLGKMCQTGEDLYTNVIVDEKDEIVAGLVGAIVPIRKLNKMSRNLLLPQPQNHERLFYIMTLGTVTEHRNGGLASSLIEECIQHVVQPDRRCGAVYLHVITLNHSAIRFYERLGFWRVQEIPDYYTIDGINYNCYLYAKYFHGTFSIIIIIIIARERCVCVSFIQSFSWRRISILIIWSRSG